MSEKQHHTQTSTEDFRGNGEIGRIVLVPGSRMRAEQLSRMFTRVTKVISNDRDLTFYFGEVDSEYGVVEVAAGPSGMGPGSAEIVGGEALLFSEVKNYIRVGTSGTMQKEIGFGDFVISNSGVRDEKASWDYAPPEFPAVAHYTTIIALMRAAIKLDWKNRTFVGPTHSKSSLWAREIGVRCPNQKENKAYKEKLFEGKIFNSEMEITVAMIQALINQPVINLQQLLTNPNQEIKVGCVCCVINDFPKESSSNTDEDEGFSGGPEAEAKVQEEVCQLAITGAIELYAILSGKKPII